MASRSGLTVYVVIGLFALGASSDPGCEAPPPAGGGSDDFSFAPAPGAVAGGDEAVDRGDAPPGEGDDFSFAPDPGAETETAGRDERCDAVIEVDTTAGPVAVPAVSGLLTDDTADCVLAEGDDDRAVAALQVALVLCNGQDVAVDGDFGPATRQAVAAVEARHGLPTDGSYGPDTLPVMRWPVAGGASPEACVDGTSLPRG